jgi:23S rRNA (uracil1939-C5)-methyltransferase
VTTPFCRHFGPCGGCGWQDVAYAEQLKRKEQHLSSLLEHSLGKRAPRVLSMRGTSGDPPRFFRHKAAFVFGEAEDRQIALGHYAADSRHIVPVIECPVHAPRANHIAFALVDHLRRARVTAAGPSLRGIARHVIVRTTKDEREAVATLVVTRNDKSLRPPIRAFLATADAPDGFYLNVHDAPGPYMVGREMTRLAGRSHIREHIAGVSYLLSPTTFFQTNVEAAEQLVTLVVESVPQETGLDILELYAGSGLFSIPLGRAGHRVLAVEENRHAIHDLEANVRLNKLPPGRVKGLAMRVEDALARVANDRFDVVILDPPRQGCPPAVIRTLFRKMRPPTIVYVSCNPESLAAELVAIVDAGYEAVHVQPVDMFPHTTHIETVVRLEARRAPRARSRARLPVVRPI